MREAVRSVNPGRHALMVRVLRVQPETFLNAVRTAGADGGWRAQFLKKKAAPPYGCCFQGFRARVYLTTCFLPAALPLKLLFSHTDQDRLFF
ncbi:MAG: hypothetical protein CVU71_13335 [Deltaproteobacteria bacterium HGW-Deltaproteobacteria-6]|nr:MAG: hypothetical protein CVU71_13335 [Deltaproteobacteria bacterium HGW-Deltaproteobacteria-6]